ncbi:MAG: altronate dehydratase family protein [Alphaproteobacteria bacterium]|nr:altronate dehydratase family protein [Alphaproteobacteria bacterium]MBU1514818.1 altronate dehydratase family protein [Alphaproteobacteria bacterium]MBU2093949.1 altronate dehydratase family protein [Alphaproteobacteria bacterium]MBU2153376.1 altronate dehydratase family protein [Alphaproteobacteria bacterium]MBU2309804.1 altronate dehydratase family protein [Alphaproteobacteria bacterium]
MTEPAATLVIDPRDDVAVALRGVAAGDRVAEGVTALVDIPAGHKVALRAIDAGADVRKYGWPIGHATQAIAAGDHVHSHNLATSLSGVETYDYAPAPAEALPSATAATFQGYRRADGRVGTRNQIWVLCTVGCVARTAQKIAAEADRRFKGRIDGVVALTHPFGCSQLGGDLDATRTMIAALADHPNAGGVLILGLGCESNQLQVLLDAAPHLDRRRLRAFTAQAAGDEIEEGLAAVAELVAIAEHDRREPCSVADLVVGVKCGGSDGFSGLTANPVVGRIADKVSAAKGTAILTEIPEIFGAERLLMARATTQAVFDEVVAVVNDFKRYFLSHGEPVSENPSPGNKDGGITTLEEKSLGAVQKGGRGQVTEVVRYGGQARSRGLVLLEAPGNDAVSSTALTAAGATVILFTTGRGTPLGFPAPTLKIATNSGLAQRKPRWIDFDAGRIVSGESVDSAADRLMDLVLATASGQVTRAEENGEREIALWKRGVTL